MIVKRHIRPALLCASLLVGLHILGAFFPSSFTWGFHSLAFFPPWATLLYACAAFCIILWALRGDPPGLLRKASDSMARRPWLWLAAALALFIASAVFLRVKAPLLGDGFFLVKNFSEAAHSRSPLLLRNEPLATLYYYGMMQLTQASTYEGFLRSFLLAQALLGAGFITCALFTARTVFERPEDQLLGFLMAVSLVSMQLFFGYVETYGALLATMSLYILVSARYLRGKASFILVTMVFLLVILTHFLALLLVPSWLYLGLREYRRRGLASIAIAAGLLAAVLLGILVAVNFQLERFTASVPHSHLLPLERTSSTEEEFSSPYNLLSAHHALDIFNFAVLTSAASLILLGIALVRGGIKSLLSPAATFFATAAIPAALFLLGVKFDLGPAKDWDVLSSFALPLSLGALAAIFAARKGEDEGPIALLLLVMFLNTGTFIALNASENAGLHRMISLVDKRSMSHLSCYSASLTLALYYHQVHDTAGPVRVWERYSADFPADSMGYRNLIRNLENEGREARSRDIARSYEKWMANVPGDTAAGRSFARFSVEEGDRESALGRTEEATRSYRRAIGVDSLQDIAYTRLGKILEGQGDLTSAIRLFQRSAELNPASPESFMDLADCYRALKDRQKTLDMLQAAAARGSGAAAESLRQKGLIR